MATNNAPDVFNKPRLSPEQVAFFNEQGYLLPQQQIYSGDKFSRLKSFFDDLFAEWVADPRTRSPEYMDVPHFLHPSLFDWLFDDEVLNLVEPIIGPDIALFSSGFICKPAATGKRVPWHEDASYWHGRLDPMKVVTVWLAIDPSSQNNGCMRVLPGTHRSGAAGFSQYERVADQQGNVFDTEIKKGTYDASKAVDCVLRAGQASLHDGRIVHGSTPNSGSIRRCGYTMRYMSTEVRQASDDGGFTIYLARGKDKAGNSYGDPTKPNTAWINRNRDRFFTRR